MRRIVLFAHSKRARRIRLPAKIQSRKKKKKKDPAPRGCGRPTSTPCSVASTCRARPPPQAVARGWRPGRPGSPDAPRPPPPRGPRAGPPRTHPCGWSGAGRGRSARSSDPLGARAGGAALAQRLRSARSLSRERGRPGSGQVLLKGRRGPGLGRGAGKGPDTLAHTAGKPTAENAALEGGRAEGGRARWKEGAKEGGWARAGGRAGARGPQTAGVGVWRPPRVRREAPGVPGCGRPDRVRAGPGRALPVTGAKMSMPNVVIPHSPGNNKAQERLLCCPRAVKSVLFSLL